MEKSWSVTFPADTIPNEQQISEFITNSLWENLNEHIKSEYKVSPAIDYSGCGMQPGWNIKYKKGGKSLCTLYPMDGYFFALVVIGRNAIIETEAILPLFSQPFQEKFLSTKELNGSKWLMLEIRSETDFEDVIKAIDMRIKFK